MPPASVRTCAAAAAAYGSPEFKVSGSNNDDNNDTDDNSDNDGDDEDEEEEDDDDNKDDDDGDDDDSDENNDNNDDGTRRTAVRGQRKAECLACRTTPRRNQRDDMQMEWRGLHHLFRSAGPAGPPARPPSRGT